MTAYLVKNSGFLGKAFKVRGGFQVVAAGQEAEVETARPLTEQQLDALARDSVKVTEKRAEKAKAEAPEGGPKAVHRGARSWSVMDGDQELVEKLTKEEAASFNALEADAKAAFIADRTKD